MDLSTNQEPKKATKVCTKCGRELPVDQFSRRKTSPDGLQQWCKACHRIANKQANGRRQLPPPSRATHHHRLRNLHRVSLSKNCITVAIAASFNTSTQSRSEL